MRQNLSARGISQRRKGSVQCRQRIFNHLVNYVAALLQCANIFFTICGRRPAAATLHDERFFVHDVRNSCPVAAEVTLVTRARAPGRAMSKSPIEPHGFAWIVRSFLL